jgi:hypothetical protein
MDYISAHRGILPPVSWLNTCMALVYPSLHPFASHTYGVSVGVSVIVVWRQLKSLELRA